MEKVYPLKFTPFLRTMVWGGDKIKAYKGIATDVPKIGESWEISSYPGMESYVSDGPLKGKTPTEVYGSEFPLLIKFIDAHDDLSIQVHPDDAMAKSLYGPQARGKTEMWYVISADPGATLYSGLSREISPEEYGHRVKDGSIVEVLQKHEVSAGDVFFLPAGRIHAICSGCFIAEIQQTSDYTYRIWDYNRPGLDGKPRALHTELAKKAIDYTVYPDYRVHYTPCKNAPVELVSCDFFVTTLYELDKPFRMASEDGWLVVMCLSGSGSVGGVPVKRGDTLMVPASPGGTEIVPLASMTLLTSRPGR